MEEDYKPGQLPYPEQNERKRFFEFHYKGLLIVLIPLLFSPILLGPETIAYRMLYLSVCVYLYYIFNVMSQGAIAFLFIVFLPICGVSSSKPLCMAYYSDLIFEVYGCVFIGIAMDAAQLSERLSIYVLDLVGTNLRYLQFVLIINTLIESILFESVFVTAFWMKVTQAVMAEYAKAGILPAISEEETYERQAQPYPSWPAVGFYLTVCYSATMGAMMSPYQNPNNFVIGIFNMFITKSPGGFLKFFIIPVILGAAFLAIWINIMFLGLLGGKMKEQVQTATSSGEAMRKAIAEKRAEMGSWTIHAILVNVFLVVLAVFLMFRRPHVLPGWADQIHLANCGSTVAVIAICVILFAVPANYYFLRYYVCRQPEKQSTAPSLVGWKVVNANTPWAHIYMLGAAHGFVYSLRDSKLLQITLDALVRNKLNVSLSMIIGSGMATVLTILAPATVLARITLLDTFKAGVNLKNGVGSIAIPYAISLHNQFMLPCSSAANTIVSGWGNIRPFQFLIGGVVPTLFMFIFICAGLYLYGEDCFPGYLKVSNEDFQFTYKP